MTVELRTLRVVGDFDASGYTRGAQQKVAADKEMSASSQAVGQAITVQDQKISQAGDVLARLSRQYVDGYANAQRMTSALNALSRGVETGRISMAQAVPVLEGIHRKYGEIGNAATIASRGQAELAAAISATNAKMASQERQAAETAAALTRVGQTPVAARAMGANDNGRRQILGYQGFDIGQGLAAGTPLAIIAAQQGPQIAQLYAGQGGLNALWKDATSILGGLVRAAGPWIAAAGAIYGAYKLISSYGVEASLAVDKTTKALAAQAAPLGSVQSAINEVVSLQKEYNSVLAMSGDVSDLTTTKVIGNLKRELDARRAMLDLELLRQQAAVRVNQSETAIQAYDLRSQIATGINTRMDLERQGFADPRIGSVPFVRLPDDITGLARTQQMIDASPAAQRLKELRAEGELTRLTMEKLQDAVKGVFAPENVRDPITGRLMNPKTGQLMGGIPVPSLRGIDDRPINPAFGVPYNWDGSQDWRQDLRGDVKGFFTEFSQGLMQGRNFGEAFGDAILNALNKRLDSIINKGVDALLDAVLGPSFQPTTTLAKFLGYEGGAANDNIASSLSAPLGAVTRAPLGAVGSAGGSIASQAWDFFKSKGLADHQVAGILGNIRAESGFNPAAIGDGGKAFGLFQHHAARGGGQSLIGSGATGQLQHAWNELQGSESGVLARLRAATDVRSATAAFGGFERPLGWSAAKPEGMHNFSGRLAGAESALSQFGGVAKEATKGLGAFGNGLGQMGDALSKFPAAPSGGGGIGGFLGRLFGAGLPSLSFMNSISPAATTRIMSGNWTGGLFADGGFTGVGGKHEPAGIVHRGEFVFDAETTSRIGVQNLESMRRMPGYAAGGLVGGRVYANSNARPISVTINKAPADYHQEITQDNDEEGNERVNITFSKIAASEAGRSGSPLNRQLKRMGASPPRKRR